MHFDKIDFKITANETILLVDTQVKFRCLGWEGEKFDKVSDKT
jgi:hypothetical protein